MNPQDQQYQPQQAPPPPPQPVEQPQPGQIPPPNPAFSPAPNLHPMVVLQKDERVIGEIHRHAFGIVSLYLSSTIAIIIAAIVVAVLLPNLLADQFASALGYIYLGLGVVGVMMMLILIVATYVYWQNKWVVTTDSITQITQNSLFSQQVSQLSMENLEDVTVDQTGILQHIFNFGTLKVESAGERSKFVFIYCPHPEVYARRILEAHETFLEERRNIRNLHVPTYQNVQQG